MNRVHLLVRSDDAEKANASLAIVDSAVDLRSAGRALVAAVAAGVVTELVNVAHMRLMMARQISSAEGGRAVGSGAVSSLT